MERASLTGRREDWTGGIVNPAVWRASTILFDSVAEMRSATGGLGSHYYGLHGTETHWALMEALTELDLDETDLPNYVFPTGMRGFQEFLQQPERADAILERLETTRARIFK